MKKDSINDSNIPNGLCNVTEGVPSLPPVESQDTAYEPKSKVTDRYANRHVPGHARNNIKEGGSILEVTMDDEDNYCSEEGHYCEKRIESYVNELIPPYTTLAIPPVQIKGYQHLYKSTKTTSSGRVFASHKATTKHGFPRNDNARRNDRKKNKKIRQMSYLDLNEIIILRLLNRLELIVHLQFGVNILNMLSNG